MMGMVMTSVRVAKGMRMSSAFQRPSNRTDFCLIHEYRSESAVSLSYSFRGSDRSRILVFLLFAGK